jgi:hypothetical protein
LQKEFQRSFVGQIGRKSYGTAAADRADNADTFGNADFRRFQLQNNLGLKIYSE